MKIIVPLSIILAKSGQGKKYYLNLNNYRNWHYQVNNNLKKRFAEDLIDQLYRKKLKTPIVIKFYLYKGSRIRTDRSNILSIIDKYFCDALTHYKCIPDDNDDYIDHTEYYTDGIDKDNPRCEILIKTANRAKRVL